MDSKRTVRDPVNARKDFAHLRVKYLYLFMTAPPLLRTQWTQWFLSSYDCKEHLPRALPICSADLTLARLNARHHHSRETSCLYLETYLSSGTSLDKNENFPATVIGK